MFSIGEINDYLNGKNAYLWHISDLKIYDKPKELGEFGRDMPIKEALMKNAETFGKYDCCHCMHHEWLHDRERCNLNKSEPICEPRYPLTRPPQSWCYVEE